MSSTLQTTIHICFRAMRLFGDYALIPIWMQKIHIKNAQIIVKFNYWRMLYVEMLEMLELKKIQNFSITSSGPTVFLPSRLPPEKKFPLSFRTMRLRLVFQFFWYEVFKRKAFKEQPCEFLQWSTNYFQICLEYHQKGE